MFIIAQAHLDFCFRIWWKNLSLVDELKNIGKRTKKMANYETNNKKKHIENIIIIIAR